MQGLDLFFDTQVLTYLGICKSLRSLSSLDRQLFTGKRQNLPESFVTVVTTRIKIRVQSPDLYFPRVNLSVYTRTLLKLLPYHLQKIMAQRRFKSSLESQAILPRHLCTQSIFCIDDT